MKDDRDCGTQREQTLAGLVKRLARRLHPEDNLRVLATEYLKEQGFFSSLRTSGVMASQPVAWRYPIGGGRYAATTSEEEARRASTDGTVDPLYLASGVDLPDEGAKP